MKSCNSKPESKPIGPRVVDNAISTNLDGYIQGSYFTNMIYGDTRYKVKVKYKVTNSRLESKSYTFIEKYSYQFSGYKTTGIRYYSYILLLKMPPISF